MLNPKKDMEGQKHGRVGRRLTSGWERELGERNPRVEHVILPCRSCERNWAALALLLFPSHFFSIFDRESFFPFFCSFLYFYFSLFSFFPFLPCLSFHFSFPIPFFGKSGFSILFAFPWGDSAVLCFGGKNEDSFFTGQGSKRSEVVFQWGLLSWEPNLDIWGETNLGDKVSVSGRTSTLFHKARVTMMIWK